MRTTLTIDDDLVAVLHKIVRETGRPFKRVVNDALRAGLSPPAITSTKEVSYPTFSLGLRAGIDLDRARHLATDMEDDEVVRKLELRK